MKIVLLAGGKSERIKPFYEKPLLQFCGKALIRHQLESLFEAGGRDFLIIGSENNLAGIEAETAIFQQEFPEASVEMGLQKIDHGSAGALKSVEKQKYLSAKGEDKGILLVSSNDILELSAYTGLMHTVEQNPGCSVILGQKIDSYFPGGYLMINKQNELQKIIEKPGAGNEPSDLINIVVHYHPSAQKLLQFVEEAHSEHDDIYETAVDNLIKAGHKVKVSHYSGKWQAVKYPWHIYEAARILFEKELRWRSRKAAATEGNSLIAADLIKADSAVIKGDVIIESGVRLMDNAVVIGPAYLGPKCVVANNALVRESFLGRASVAGYNTEIARSYLGNDVWTHSNYLGDSVIGHNVSFGAGAITGNLRLDEKPISILIKGQKVETGKNKIGLFCGNDVRVGINTSMMPGVKIGARSMIGAGLVIAEDIPEDKFVTGKMDLIIKDNLAEVPQDRSSNLQKLVKS
jgi:NDP-sugar pyrophosphorylase family protein